MFSSLQRPDRFWGPHSLLSNGYRGLFPLREATTPSGAEVKNDEAMPSLPHSSSWLSALLIKPSHNFIFTFYLYVLFNDAVSSSHCIAWGN
jgi:hypothetical protein